MEHLQQIAMAAGLAWASGIRLYAVLFVVGLMGKFGWLSLPGDLKLLEHDVVLGVSGVMLAAEFLADKIPGFDSIWDSVHTFIRIPAGALLAWGAFGDANPAMQMAAAIAGGAIASSSHFTKAGTRAVINTSPEPFSNWGASFSEEAAVAGGLWLALAHPAVFLVLLAVFIVLAIWLVPKLWRAIKRVFALLARVTGSADTPPPVRHHP